jgi:RNA polymerase sigma factor for flagellar operon FliA
VEYITSGGANCDGQVHLRIYIRSRLKAPESWSESRQSAKPRPGESMQKEPRRVVRQPKRGALQPEGTLPPSMIPGSEAGNVLAERHESQPGTGISRNSDLKAPAENVAGSEGLKNEDLIQEGEIAAHLSMVRFLARRIHERLPSHVELEELVGAGVLGLMDAYKKFNPDKKVKFRSYAQFRVRGAILDSLRTLDWSPRELRRKAREIDASVQRLTARCGRTPHEGEVAAEMKMTLSEYQHLLGDLKSLELGTLNAERSQDSGEEELAYVPSRAEEDPLFQYLRGEMHGRLREAIDRLSERERLILNLYYFEELTMKEIGQVLGVVESRISQVHASAVVHLRSSMQAFHR